MSISDREKENKETQKKKKVGKIRVFIKKLYPSLCLQNQGGFQGFMLLCVHIFDLEKLTFTFGARDFLLAQYGQYFFERKTSSGMKQI